MKKRIKLAPGHNGVNAPEFNIGDTVSWSDKFLMIKEIGTITEIRRKLGKYRYLIAFQKPLIGIAILEPITKLSVGARSLVLIKAMDS